MNRRGAVLLTTLAALILLGGITAALLLAALREVRAGRNAEAALVARAAATAAVATATATGDGLIGSLAVGDSAIVTGAVGGVAFEARLVRSGDELVGVRGIGIEPRLGVRRDVVATVRIVPLLPLHRAVSLLRHPVPALLAGRVVAADSVPAGWTCPPSGAAAPPMTDTAVQDSVFFGLGPIPWPAIAAWAGRPRSLDSLTPRAVTGDMTLDGGRSLGLLVVDGVLTLRGGAEVLGVVVARQGVVFGPGGGVVLGEVVAESLGLVSGVTPGSVLVSYSSCLAGRAGRSGAPLAGLPGLPPLDAW